MACPGVKGTHFVLVLLLVGLAACNLQTNSLLPTSTSTVSPTAFPTFTPPPLDLNHEPLYWFAPLPRDVAGLDRGAVDYLSLFDLTSDWAQAARHLQVFKFYGGWVAREVSSAQLNQAIIAIRQRGLALAVEVGPLNPTNTCGLFVEGFAGIEGIDTLRKIKAAEGDLNFIALDEPYFYGHFYDGDKACHWTAEKIARDVDDFIRQARTIFPEATIGYIEPMTDPADPIAYETWLETFKAVNGYDLAFLHMDIDWADPSWPRKMLSVEAYGQEHGIPIGIIYTGNPQDQTNQTWLAIAGIRVKRYEMDNGGTTDHVIFQSWNDKPDHVLPESDPASYTGFLQTYFENRFALGFQPGANSNLALQASVSVSQELPGQEGIYAIDGDPGTIWNSGDGPPQWIEIDLGAPRNIQEIRLVISQYPAGATTHRLLVRGPDPGTTFTLLQTFTGETTDSQIMEYIATIPLQDIQVIRIETTTSPSWVAWREVEVIQAGGQ